jgi:hypothetical protein
VNEIARWRLLGLLPLVALLSGCLQMEESEVRILREQGEPAVVVTTWNNIYSDETDPVKIQKDFDELINNWREKDFLKKRWQEGILVKNRELFVRDGKISGQETGLLFNLDKLNINLSADDAHLQMEWDEDRDGMIVETNGHVMRRTDKTIIEWPKNASVLQVKSRDTLEPAFETSQPMMLKLLVNFAPARN